MNKTELVTKVSEKTEYSKKACEEIVKATFEAITEELQNGGSFSLIGFGTFSVSERAERKAKNPATGAEIVIPATKVPRFKAGKALKEAVK